MRKTLLMMGTGMLFMMACRQPPGATEEAAAAHFAEVRLLSKGRVCIDKVSAEKLMQVTGEGKSNSHFYAYSVRFEDSIQLAEKETLQKWDKYFQFDMEKDWVVLSQGDSIRPVFFQPGVKMSAQISEGVLVFEMPAAAIPDSLIYLNSFGSWEALQVQL
ncbi:MAG: hypothetical protein P0Y53_16410 [Candidatus Pseudobacter hemicellulosilyticus]|uniref:Uncharacterized protein n=1 Tax=Candidatus Pseudobacter hemicellulosilyticus TaxID=3121375 RepID=A0AAJ6BGF0_9BACT|nr:MAG: hypothetical protein P0Y53_16410 [Pseudobacter sp.]